MKNSLCVLSCKGETLPLVRDLRGEGIPSDIYLHDPHYASSYKNILPRVRLEGLVKAIERAEVVVIGVGTAHDETMEGAIKKAYEKVDEIKITGNKQFWPLQEHLDSHQERYKRLQKWGIIQ